ncbi:MAG: phosphoenolpyruvate--protein phosphotransferase [Planctomycetaceae bacterium]|nr:phosphoenolpyruvate--protein phosphotransferase [Planctomycetaceae bacterium]
MLVKRGIAVSPGVAIGPVLVMGADQFRIPHRFVSVDAVDTEIARFRAALDSTCQEIVLNEKLASERLGAQYAAIFSAHLLMARDQKILTEIESLIRKKSFSPEFAVSRVLHSYAKRFQNLGDQYFAERADDLFDLEKRMLKHLLGERREELSHLTAPVLLLAHNLTPSETAGLDKKYVLGFATEVGGYTSHTAILAGALELPAVVGIGNFLADVSGGETIIIDGSHGVVIIDPDEDTLAKYRDSEERFRSYSHRLESLLQLPSETRDGVAISLYGNIEFPEEAIAAQHRGAEGIGLYRTEFLYLESQKEPTEEDHYQAYCEVLKAFPKQPVVIRTLDLGADKMPGNLRAEYADEINPALSVRSIRLSMQHLELFKTQLRAILRAAVHGDMRVMFPLVTTLLEFRQARMILADVMEDLEELGIPFRRDISVGMMVEVPAAAILAEEFAREVDFFSIGTNDLIQYTLAVDRGDPAVANLYRAGDPSILRLLRGVISAARRHRIPVSVCGQMSSDPIFLPLLIGMGLRQLSATPHAIPELKEVVRSLTIAKAERIASRAEGMDLARDVENYLRGELRKICPDAAE